MYWKVHFYRRNPSLQKQTCNVTLPLGGGFKHFSFFTPGEIIQFDVHYFFKWVGSNHQLVQLFCTKKSHPGRSNSLRLSHQKSAQCFTRLHSLTAAENKQDKLTAWAVFRQKVAAESWGVDLGWGSKNQSSHNRWLLHTFAESRERSWVDNIL